MAPVCGLKTDLRHTATDLHHAATDLRQLDEKTAVQGVARIDVAGARATWQRHRGRGIVAEAS